jgi:hypothetical protein
MINSRSLLTQDPSHGSVIYARPENNGECHPSAGWTVVPQLPSMSAYTSSKLYAFNSSKDSRAATLTSGTGPHIRGLSSSQLA